MASQKRNRANALKDLKLAREGGGRAKQYKVCLVVAALNDYGPLTDDAGRHRHGVVRSG
jgi:hypothetical protein